MKKIILFLFNIFFFVKCLNKSNKLYSKNIKNNNNDNIFINNNEILYKNILNNNIIDNSINNDNKKINSKKFIREKITNLNSANSDNNDNNSDNDNNDNNSDNDNNDNNSDNNNNGEDSYSDNSDSEEDKYLKCFPNKTYFISTIIVIGLIIIFVIFVSMYKYCPKKNNIEDEIQISFTDVNQIKNDKILFNDK